MHFIDSTFYMILALYLGLKKWGHVQEFSGTKPHLMFSWDFLQKDDPVLGDWREFGGGGTGA